MAGLTDPPEVTVRSNAYECSSVEDLARIEQSPVRELWMTPGFTNFRLAVYAFTVSLEVLDPTHLQRGAFEEVKSILMSRRRVIAGTLRSWGSVAVFPAVVAAALAARKAEPAWLFLAAILAILAVGLFIYSWPSSRFPSSVIHLVPRQHAPASWRTHLPILIATAVGAGVGGLVTGLVLLALGE